MKRTETIQLVRQLGGSYCAVRRPSDQAIANASTTTVDFTSGATVEDDTDSMFATTDSAKLTVVRGGVYVLTGYVNWATAATGIRLLSLSVDAGVVATVRQPVVDGIAYQVVTATVGLESGAVVTMSVRQSSGDSLDIVAADSAPRLTAVRVI